MIVHKNNEALISLGAKHILFLRVPLVQQPWVLRRSHCEAPTAEQR